MVSWTSGSHCHEVGHQNGLDESESFRNRRWWRCYCQWSSAQVEILTLYEMLLSLLPCCLLYGHYEQSLPTG